jgi:UPF0271 protein
VAQVSTAERSSWIDINSDVGELDDGGETDDLLLEIITSANVACGGHAGDRASMDRICRTAAARRIAIGAQVSYPDRQAFGRRRLDIALPDLKASLHDQVCDLIDAAESATTTVTYLKPHGALYHVALDDAAIAELLLEIATTHGLAVLTMSSGELHTRAGHHDVPVFREAFIDRGYTANGRLTPRDLPGAILDPEAALERLLTWSRDGLRDVDSLCVHSDTPDAVRLARLSREALESHGVTIEPFITVDPTPPHR